MDHSELVGTLVVALVAASVGGYIAIRLGLPPLVGYLLAGIAIGPYTPGGSANSQIATALSEVGVILLMFGVGLHFSLRELWSVRSIAVPGALGQIILATALGFGLSALWGWSISEGLLFGLCLSVASTVVLLRALEDRQALESAEGRIAVGWLVIEDLFTVLVLVVVPALSPGDNESRGLAGLIGGQRDSLVVLLALVQAGGFVVSMLFFGVKAIPRILAAVAQTGSRELFTLCVLGIALGVAFGSAELFGVSLALGAFLAGLVLNESELSHRAGLEALPLRDAFAVLFFIAVGMIFDPEILLQAPHKVLGVVGIVMLGKSLAAFAIVLVLGHGLRVGMTVSAALAQIGEFSFILSAMAVSLGLLPVEAGSLVLAAAIISITLNPFLFRQSDRLYAWVDAKGWAAKLTRNTVDVPV